MEVIWIHEVIGNAEALVAKKALELKTVEDLIGRRVGVPFGSTTHYHLFVALKLSQIPSVKIRMVNLEPKDIQEAWKANEIDAAFIWEPTQSRLLEEGGEVIVSSRELAERGYPTADLCAVRKDFGEKYPSVVSGYLKNLDRAVQFLRTEPQKAIEAVARQMGNTPEETSRQASGLIMLTAEEQLTGKYVGEMKWDFGIYMLLKDTADFLVEVNELEASLPWAVFMRAVNPTFLKSVVQQ